MQAIQKPWIKLKETLDREDHKAISALEAECVRRDGASLKLELDYKLGAAAASGPRAAMRAVNELMYYDGERLIGYIGIGDFGGAGKPPELSGMVHPDYRRLGVFQTLSGLAISECERRKSRSILLLCDRKSLAGQAFVAKTGARFHHSEFEMYLRKDKPGYGKDFPVLDFKKAVNADAMEVARQNAIFFGEEDGEAHDPSEEGGALEGEKDASVMGLIMPEEEEKKGMVIYFGLHKGFVIGKVHLQLVAGVGGIYGLGVLPEYRGKGFGRALLMGGVERLTDAGAKEIMLQVVTENANALHLYESCGFKVTSTMVYYEMGL